MLGINKLWLYAAGGIAIAGIIGGFWWFIDNQISSLQDQLEQKNQVIEQRNEKIASLELDNQKLRESNDSLEKEVDQKETEIREYIKTVTELRQQDERLEQELDRLRSKLNNEERDERIQKILQSDKASLILRLMNKDAKCEIEHFGENGECVAGRWKPDSSDSKDEGDSTNGESTNGQENSDN